jgi:hypothetical protein
MPIDSQQLLVPVGLRMQMRKRSDRLASRELGQAGRFAYRSWKRKQQQSLRDKKHPKQPEKKQSEN